MELKTRPSAASGRELTGSIALVTGGGRGLGSAICQCLAEAGATVIAADIQPVYAETLAASLREDGHSAEALALDVSDAAATEAAVDSVIARHGRLDILINNAGVDFTRPIEELTVEQFDRVLAVNLRGPFLMAKAAFARMRAQGGGQVVNIVSTAAKRTWIDATAYHASKWGLLGFSHALHVEGRPHQIKVTAVIAGGMRTPFLLERFPDIDVNNLQDPRNVADTVRYVLSLPGETVIPEIFVLPMRETSWP